MIQQSNGELASRGGAENSLTDGPVRRRVGSTLSELVTCESDGTAPLEQVLACELTAEAQRAVAEVALLPVDGRKVMGPGPGTLRSKSREAAFPEVRHADGDEGPAVAAGTGSGDTSGAPEDAWLPVVGSNPSSTEVGAPADAAPLGEINAVCR